MIPIPQFVILKNPDYRYTLSANMFSGASMWALIVATAWFIFESAESSGWVGILFFAQMLPYLVISPVGGFLADKYERRILIVWGMRANFFLTCFLLLLVITDIAELWQIAILVFLIGTSRAIIEPSIGALIPNQVSNRDLLSALSLNAMTRHGSRLVLFIAAPMLATHFIGVVGVVFMSVILQLCGALLMTRVTTVSKGEKHSDFSLFKGMADGLVYIYSNYTIALFVLMAAFHCALVMSFDSVLPLFSEQQLDATDGSMLGYLVMAFGLGSLVALFFVSGLRDDKWKAQTLLLTAITSGVTPMILGISGNLPVAFLASFGMGASQASFMALTNTYVQSICPDRLRGRISSLYILHAGGIMAFANLGFGFIADIFSATPVLVVASGIYTVIIVLLFASQPLLRRLSATGKIVLAH